MINDRGCGTPLMFLLLSRFMLIFFIFQFSKYEFLKEALFAFCEAFFGRFGYICFALLFLGGFGLTEASSG
jgi:hypothetical protein